MHDYFFSIAGKLTLHFQCAVEPNYIEHTTLLLGAHIPDIKRIEQPHSQETDLTISVEIYPEQLVSLKTENTIQALTNNPDYLPEDVYHLLYAMVRKKLAEQHLYCVHAACVGRDNEYRLLVGHSGAGKTTLADKLIEHHQMQLFSGNKTVIQIMPDGKMMAIAGTKTMTKIDERNQRIPYTLPAEQCTAQKQVTISAIDIIRVNDGVKECDMLRYRSNLHNLFPFFMDAVNADVIYGMDNVFDGNIAQSVKQIMLEEITHALTTLPVRKITGPFEFLENMTKGPT